MVEADDLLYEGQVITIRAMRRRNGSLPAKEWVEELDAKGRGLFFAAARIIENSISSGRSYAGRAEQVSKPIWELKITKPGSKPPHYRLFYVRQKRVLWATHGFTKKKNRTPSSEIEKAHRIYDEWKNHQ